MLESRGPKHGEDVGHAENSALGAPYLSSAVCRHIKRALEGGSAIESAKGRTRSGGEGAGCGGFRRCKQMTRCGNRNLHSIISASGAFCAPSANSCVSSAGCLGCLLVLCLRPLARSFSARANGSMRPRFSCRCGPTQRVRRFRRAGLTLFSVRIGSTCVHSRDLMP